MRKFSSTLQYVFVFGALPRGEGGGIYILVCVAIVLLEMELLNLCAWR
jgi:hypothetical protein